MAAEGDGKLGNSSFSGDGSGNIYSNGNSNTGQNNLTNSQSSMSHTVPHTGPNCSVNEQPNFTHDHYLNNNKDFYSVNGQATTTYDQQDSVNLGQSAGGDRQNFINNGHDRTKYGPIEVKVEVAADDPQAKIAFIVIFI